MFRLTNTSGYFGTKRWFQKEVVFRDWVDNAKWGFPMRKFFQNESGATAIEYGLIAALIAVAIIGAVSALGGNAANTFNEVAAEMA